MIHEMSLRDRPYRAIAGGWKTVELRLFDEKRQAILVGDLIRFTHGDTGESMTAEVAALHRCADFEALYAALLPRYGAEALGYTADETPMAADMLDYYPADRIARYGVVGIEIQMRSDR